MMSEHAVLSDEEKHRRLAVALDNIQQVVPFPRVWSCMCEAKCGSHVLFGIGELPAGMPFKKMGGVGDLVPGEPLLWVVATEWWRDGGLDLASIRDDQVDGFLERFATEIPELAIAIRIEAASLTRTRS